LTLQLKEKGPEIKRSLFCIFKYPTDGITSITGLQIPSFEKGVRAYVKVIGDKAHLRTEKSLMPNKPIGEALEKTVKHEPE
jgi:hypothetical protein